MNFLYMKKISTQVKILTLFFALISPSITAMAGDGTRANPYTVAELNAQKDALAASGATVWVKADLKGLGEDGTKAENADTEDANGKTIRHMAGLFGDATGNFVAYSYQILSQLAISDLTNTKDLLIALTYGTQGHPHGNSTYPQYATDYEKDVVTENRFSLESIHGALSVTVSKGFRGYHIASSYVVPKDIVAARVTAGYTGSNGATISYGYYDGAEKDYIINKNTALVFLAYDGTYDLVLSAGYYEQISSNSLNGGEQAGVNTIPMKNNALRYHYRFTASGDKVGFERNRAESTEVSLEAKDEIYMTVNGNDTHFYGHWNWETADKNWITWGGKSIADFTNHTTGISEVRSKANASEAIYNLQGVRLSQPQKGLNIINGKKIVVK